jgi:hypothetical protein
MVLLVKIFFLVSAAPPSNLHMVISFNIGKVYLPGRDPPVVHIPDVQGGVGYVQEAGILPLSAAVAGDVQEGVGHEPEETRQLVILSL